MSYAMGPRIFEAESVYLTLSLRESDDVRRDAAALRQRLADDGYLLLRGVHPRSAVTRARESLMTRLAARGALDPDAPLDKGIMAPGYGGPTSYSARANADLKTDALRTLVYGDAVMALFDHLFGVPSAAFRFQWPRAVGPGGCTPIHCDAPFMSRGSSRLLTCWTPLDDIEPEFGPLVICEGSHRWQRVIDTYGRSDVDRDRTTGTFSNDPAELVERFGGRWATTTFEMGDVVILSMHILHASLTNMTNRFRLSCDTRYQPARDAMDSRWRGDDPPGHEQLWTPGVALESVEDSRARWDV